MNRYEFEGSNWRHNNCQFTGLHWVDSGGEKPILLLLHGVARNHTDWQPIVEQLASRWRIVAIDHLGHGQSKRSSGQYKVIDYCRSVERFLRESLNTRIVVLGHSLGAMVGLYLAAHANKFVRGAILEDPPFESMGIRIGESAYQAQFAGMQKVASAGGTLESMTDAFGSISVPTDSGWKTLGEMRDRASLQYSAACLQSVDPDVFTSLVNAAWLDGYDATTCWPKCRCPVLLLQGDAKAGGTLSDEDVETALRQLEFGDVRRFPGVGHQIHRTASREFLDAVERFRQGLEETKIA